MITDTKMLPILVFLTLWRYSDKDSPITTEDLVNKVLRRYFPKRTNNPTSNHRLIMRAVKNLMAFFSELNSFGEGFAGISIEDKSVRTPDGYACKGYYIENRPLGNTDIRLLCDFVLCAPGISHEQSQLLIRKLLYMASDHLKNIYHNYKLIGKLHKTDNEEVYQCIEMINDAIGRRKRLIFLYRDNELVEASPYGLTTYAGMHYCVGGESSSRVMRNFRLDRIHDMVETDETILAAEEMEGIDSKFELGDYLMTHARMTSDEVVIVYVTAMEQIADAIRKEFKVLSTLPAFGTEGAYRFRIQACKCAICNWFINIPNLAWVDDDRGSGVIEEMRRRSREVLGRYQ